MFMKLMKQKKIKIQILLCEYITPTSFLYIYILLRRGGVSVTNGEGTASPTISTLGDAAARRVGDGGPSLLPKCRQRNGPILGERARTNYLLVG